MRLDHLSKPLITLEKRGFPPKTLTLNGFVRAHMITREAPILCLAGPLAGRVFHARNTSPTDSGPCPTKDSASHELESVVHIRAHNPAPPTRKVGSSENFWEVPTSYLLSLRPAVSNVEPERVRVRVHWCTGSGRASRPNRTLIRIQHHKT